MRVEVSPDAGLAPEAFQSAVESMSRMNGGTNIALALAKAGQLLKAHTEEEGARTVVILTDGRVDSYQVRR